MKMQQQQQLQHWMDSCNFLDIPQVEEELDHPFAPIFNNNNKEKSDNDFDTCRPQSSLAYSPLGRADHDAIILTPQNMYAPCSPICNTPPNTPDTEIEDNMEDVPQSGSAEKVLALPKWMRQFSRRAPQEDMEAEDSITISDNFQNSRIGRSESNPSSILSEWKERGDSILGEESEMGDTFGISGPESCSSVDNFKANLHEALADDNKQLCELISDETGVCTGQPSAGRRMSWEEFLVSLPDTVLNQLANISTKNESDEAKETTMSNVLMQRKAEVKKGTTKVANVGRKRKASETILSSPRVYNRENCTKRKVCTFENNVLLGSSEQNVTMPGSALEDTSIAGEVGRVPDVDNINVTRRESSVYSHGIAVAGTRLRHGSLLESRTVGQGKAVRSSATPSLAAITTIAPIIDLNGNIIHAISQERDITISPWFVEENSFINQNQTSIILRDGNLPQIGDNLTKRISSAQETTSATPAPVAFENHPKHLNFTADIKVTLTKPLESMRSGSCSTLAQSSNSQQNYFNQNHRVICEENFSSENQSNIGTSLSCPNFLDPQSYQYSSDTVLASHLSEASASVPNTSMVFDSLCNQPGLDKTSVLFHDNFPQTTLNSEVTLLQVSEGESSIAKAFQHSNTEQLHLPEFDGTETNTSASDTAFNVMRSDVTSFDVPHIVSHDSLYSTNASFSPCYNNHEESKLTSNQHENNRIQQSSSLTECFTSQDMNQNASFFLQCSESSNSLAYSGQIDHVDGLKIPLATPEMVYNAVMTDGNNGNCYRELSVATPENINADATEANLTATISDHSGLIPSNLYENTCANLDMHTFNVATSNSGAIIDDTFAFVLKSSGAKRVILLPARTSIEAQTSGKVELPPISGENEAMDPSCSNVHDAVSVEVLPANADPELIEAHKRYAATGQISALVKHELRCAIKSKRHKEGKGDIEVKFEPKPNNELTEEEKEKEQRRRELNRKAAANHRERKKAKTQLSEQECEELTKKNQKLREIVTEMELEKMMIMNNLISQGKSMPSWISLPNNSNSSASLSPQVAFEYITTPGRIK